MRTLFVRLGRFTALAFLLLSHPGHAAPTFMGLGDLPGGNFYRGAYGVSEDGSTVVGASYSASGTEVFRWTSGSGMVGLGAPSSGSLGSVALAVSADGSTIVGSFVNPATLEEEAFIWGATNGMREFDLVLAALGLDLTDRTLHEAYDVSADGLTIVGSGTNTNGNTEAWIAIIPEPNTALLVGIGFVGLAASRSRRQV